jgi:signal transduction histidine kinase/ligand-binding sensor domain-containing protein/DNA-binding response OmpR family regulator
MKKLFFLLILFTFISSVLFCQLQTNMKLNKITKRDWIHSDNITVIYQDSKGFMWIGTWGNGLYRYNGYSFTEIRYEQPYADTNEYLLEEYIYCITEDKNGILWIGGNNGLYKFNPEESEKISARYCLHGHYSYYHKNAIYRICEDYKDNLWLGAGDGNNIPVFDKKNEEFFFINLKPDPRVSLENQDFWISPLIQDKDNNMWLCSNQGLYKYDQKKEEFYNYRPNPDLISDSVNSITSVFEENSNIIWVGTYKGLFTFNKKLEKFTLKFPVLSHQMETGVTGTYAIKQYKSGNIWFRTTNALYSFKPGEIELFFNKVFSYQTYDIWWNQTLEFDNSDNVWFGTWGQGINILTPERKNFRALVHNDNDPYSISRNVHCVAEDKNGNIWIGTMGNGLDKYDKEKKKIIHYLHDPLDSNSISENYISCIYHDQTGTLWVGTNFGLNKIIITPNNKLRVKRYFHDQENPGSIHRNIIWKIFEDKEYNLWVYTSNGCLNKYDRERDVFIHLSVKTYDTDAMNDFYSKAEEIEDEIWFTLWHWIARIIPPFTKTSDFTIKASKIIGYRHDPENPLSIADKKLFASSCLSTSYQPGTLWFGTYKGLGKMMRIKDEESNHYSIQIKNYTREDGFVGNVISGILEDSYGNIWVGTDKGLIKFNPRIELFTSYPVLDIFPGGLFKGGHSYKNKEGTMYFPHSEGLLIFNPDSLQDNINIPQVYITDLKVFNKSVPVGENSFLKKPITYTEEIELFYNQNFLTFEFVVLDYTDPKRNQYRYKLEGLDKNWINAGTRRIASYSNLKHGDYVFRVQGSNHNNVWNMEGVSLDITIFPPPWQTWYAYIVYGLILLSIVLLYRRFLLRRARLKTTLEIERVEKDKILEVDHLKSRFFANISHEFRTPLTLILGPVEDLFRSKKGSLNLTRDTLQMIRRNIKRLQRLINQLLDISRLETGNMKLMVARGNLTVFCRTIIQSFLSLAESKKINYEYHLSDPDNEQYYDADKLEKILSNLLSNAFKFTPEKGSITVNLSFSDSAEKAAAFAELSVKDTGIGIPGDQAEKIFDRFYQVSSSDDRDAEGTGIGLSLTRELVELYRGEIKVESTPGVGSLFTVKIPYQKHQFKPEEFCDPEIVKDTTTEFTDEIATQEKITELAKPDTQVIDADESASLILVVEDNSDLRNYITEHLKQDHALLEAENGKEGFNRATEHIPDLIITDLMMPEMDGMEMCRLLKADERTNHIPVIMLTAKADRESKLDGLKTGADDYLIKPFDAEELKVRVKNIIQQRQKLWEKFRKDFFASASKEDQIPPRDQLIRKLFQVFEEHLDDADFDIEKLGSEINMSRAQVFRKINAITGNTPKELLRNFRLQKATRLFSSGHDQITQVMLQVGFNNSSYFTKCFRELYGTTPSEFIKNKTKKSGI